MISGSPSTGRWHPRSSCHTRSIHPPQARGSGRIAAYTMISTMDLMSRGIDAIIGNVAAFPAFAEVPKQPFSRHWLGRYQWQTPDDGCRWTTEPSSPPNTVIDRDIGDHSSRPSMTSRLRPTMDIGGNFAQCPLSDRKSVIRASDCCAEQSFGTHRRLGDPERT